MKVFAVLLGIFATQAVLCQANKILRKPTFWSPKNIHISIVVPGSSHTTWVLEIGQELAEQGHNVSFLGRSYSEKYLRDYPSINSINMIDKSTMYTAEEFDAELRRNDDSIGFMKMITTAFRSAFHEDFTQYSAHFQTLKPDVLMCDHLNDPCIRAAEKYEIPLILTSTMAVYDDAEAPFINNLLAAEPTTQFQSIWTRFYYKYIFKIRLMWNLWSVIKKSAHVLQDLGISSANDIVPSKTIDSVKLVNNFFGLEPARAVGPLIRFVGPILSTSYPDMDENTAEFLSSHKKIAYIAFGHHSIVTSDEFSQLLIALIDSVESDIIDGFIWVATKVTNFPKLVTSTRGTRVNVTDLIQNENKYSHFRFSKWAAQFAILSHPSTAIFVTHAGANSLFESLYIGKKMLLHPYFGDQPYNAKMLHSAGVGLEYKRDLLNASDITHKIGTIVRDEDGFFANNLRRMSALVQLKSKEAISNAVSTVEEVIFSSDGGRIPHLYPVSRNMSYIKANNIDLQVLLTGAIVIFVVVFYYIFRVAYTHFYSQRKQKTD